VIGKPSAALSVKIEQDEKDRLAKRKAELGEEKLKQLEKDLEKAKEESDTAPPPEMIKDFPLTDVSLVVRGCLHGGMLMCVLAERIDLDTS
jgi:Zn-dependent M16 (insulinase) family peptidase